MFWTEYTGIWSKVKQMANQTGKHPLYLANPVVLWLLIYLRYFNTSAKLSRQKRWQICVAEIHCQRIRKNYYHMYNSAFKKHIHQNQVILPEFLGSSLVLPPVQGCTPIRVRQSWSPVYQGSPFEHICTCGHARIFVHIPGRHFYQSLAWVAFYHEATNRNSRICFHLL